MSTESFLEGFNTDGVLEDDEDEEGQQAQEAIDLETRLKDAEASPVVTLVDRILLQAMSEMPATSTWNRSRKGYGCDSVRTVCFSNTWSRCQAGSFQQ